MNTTSSAQRRYFGTDGMRGRVGDLPITPDLILKLGWAAGRTLAKADGARGERPAVLIGKDTRISGYLLEAALEAGLSAAGVDVYLCGPLPTPAIAYLTRALRLSAGIAISASHNPFDDNGIKFFSGGGAKLADDVELAIEAEMELPLVCAPSAELGKAFRVGDAAGRYIEFCKSTFPNELDLRGCKIVVDCAHGAGYHVAPPVFHELGAEVISGGRQAERHEHQRRRRRDAPESLAERGESERCRLWRRARRRRRSPGDGRQRRTPLRRRPAAVRDRTRLPAPRRADGRRRRHADEQPRLRAGAHANGHRACCARKSATVTCSSKCWRADGSSAARTRAI